MKKTIKTLMKPIVSPMVRSIARHFDHIVPDMFVIKVVKPGSSKSRQSIRYSGHSIKDPEGLLNRPAEAVMEKWGGRSPRFYNYDESLLESVAGTFRFHTGCPATRTFHDVVYVPEHNSLYTTDGLRIDESAGFRSPEKIKPPGKLNRFSTKLIYVGLFHKHYGHFLIDYGPARLWYAVANEQHPILGNHYDRFTPTRLFIDTFLKSVDFSRDRFVSFVKPVLLEEVVVPTSSFQGGRAYEVHRLIPENVAERLLATPPERTSQPLYFSRKSLSNQLRHIINEDQLERLFVERGYAIVHPEKLNLEQQIRLINKHEVIVGTLGSALHGVLFDMSPESRRNLVCLSDVHSVHRDYLLVDAIKKYNSTYIASLTLTPRPSSRKQIIAQDRILDLDIAVSGLREIGLL